MIKANLSLKETQNLDLMEEVLSLDFIFSLEKLIKDNVKEASFFLWENLEINKIAKDHLSLSLKKNPFERSLKDPFEDWRKKTLEKSLKEVIDNGFNS